MLLCRNHDTRSASYWMAILTYILEYVDETDLFDENRMHGTYRPFYRAFKGEGFSRMYLLLDELCRDLTLGRRLPTR